MIYIYIYILFVYIYIYIYSMVVWPFAFRFINKAVRSSKFSSGCYVLKHIKWELWTPAFQLVNKEIPPGFRKDFELRFSDCI